MTAPTHVEQAADWIVWRCAGFAGLSAADLYAVMQLRQRVFIVEQNCAYLDADGLDPHATHLMGWSTADPGVLVAYARLLPPGARFAEASIGRVVTQPEIRRTGAGLAVMARALAEVESQGWGRGIRLAAQAHLEEFYAKFGFRRVSKPYTEDGIRHVDMKRD